MRMDQPFILGFCQNVIFDMLFTIMFFIFSEKNKFLNLLSLVNHFVYLRFKYRSPILLLFQNRTLISKLGPYPEGIFHQIWDPSIALSCSILL